MSVEVDWDNISGDPQVSLGMKDFLNSRLEELELPSYVNNIRVESFNLGSVPPKITLKQMTDPLDEFYSYLVRESEIKEEDALDKNTDLQLLIEVEYSGDMCIELSAELVLNYPTPSFMLLPVKLRISDIGIHSLCLVSYLKKQVFISFLCDVADPLLDEHRMRLDPSGPSFGSKRSIERISLIRNIKIHTELGQQEQGHGSVLRSVGKLEEFLVDIIRDIFRREVAWPSWINLDFNAADDDCSDDESTTSNSESSTEVESSNDNRP